MDLLSQDLLRLLGLYLNWQEILTLKKVNRRFRDVFNENFWKYKLENESYAILFNFKDNFANYLSNRE